MQRSIRSLITLLLCLPCVQATDLGKFIVPDNNLKWSRDGVLSKQSAGHVLKVRDSKGSEMVVVLPETGKEAPIGKIRESLTAVLQKGKVGITLDKALQLNLGEHTWYGVGTAQGHLVHYKGAVSNDGLVYAVDLRVPAPGILSPAFKTFLAEVKIQRVVSPTAAAPLITQGNGQMNSKDLAGAMGFFNQAITKDPRSPEAYYFRGMCYKRMQNTEAARRDLAKALSLKRSVDFLVESAEVELEAQNHSAAISLLESALRENPESDAAYRSLGKAYSRVREREKAAICYEKALELNPAHTSTRAALVRYYGALPKPLDAQRHLQVYEVFHPGSPEIAELKRESLKSAPATLPGISPVSAGIAEAAKDDATATARMPDEKKAFEAFSQLPSLPPLSRLLASAKANPVAPALDPARFNSLQYLGVVAAVKHASEELAGPMSVAASKDFEVRWAAIQDYPAAACIEYLNKASPLLGEILSLRASMMKVIQGYDNFINQAQAAHFFGNPAAVHDAMRRAGQHAALLKALKQSSDQAVKALVGLGELPDAALIKARVAEQFTAAKSLLKNLDRPIELSGEYEAGAYRSIQDPLDRARSQQADLSIIRTEASSTHASTTFFKPLKSMGGNRVLLYSCETSADGEKSSSLEIFENLGAGVFVTYRGGSVLTKIMLELTEEGYRETEYSLGPLKASSENNDFSERMAALISKKQKPDLKLSCEVSTSNHLATHVQYQKPPADGEFDWSTWEAKVRGAEKEFIAEFEGQRLAFETLAPQVRFPAPVSPEHVFWVLDRIEVVNTTPSREPPCSLSGSQKAAEATYEKLMKRGETDHPRPLLAKKQTTSVSQTGLSYHEEQTVYREGSSGRQTPESMPLGWSISHEKEPTQVGERQVFDSMLIAYDITWSPPSPVIAQAGGVVRFDLNVTRRISTPKVAVLVPSPLTDVFARTSPTSVQANGTYQGSAGSGARASLLTQHLKSGSGTVKVGTALECPLTEFYSEHAKIELRLFQDAGLGLDFSGLNLWYRRRIMTPEEASQLAFQMGEPLEALARKTPPSQGKSSTSALNAQANKAAQLEARNASIAYHQDTLLYEQKRAQLYQNDLDALLAQVGSGKTAPTEDELKRMAALRFNIINAKSNAVAEQDNIDELKTGSYRHTETPFDVMARTQLRRNIERNIRKIEALETQGELTEKYIEFIPSSERAQALDVLYRIRNEAPDDLDRYLKLNSALKNKWMGATEAKIASMDEELAWKEAQVQALENIKTGADAGMMACSMVGGPQSLALAYQFSGGWAEKDFATGVRQSVSAYSDAVDMALSTYDGYCQGGWSGAAKAGGISVLSNKGLPFLLGRMTKGGEVTRIGASGNGKIVAGPAGKPEINAVSPKAGNSRIDDVKAYESELRQAEAQVKRFQSEVLAWKKATKAGSPADEVRRLHQQVLDTSASLNGNPTAKGYLKYKAQPAVSRYFNQSLDEIHTLARNDYYATMRQAGYSEHEIFAIRNAASSGSTGMDFDQALKEQPDFLPIKCKDGSVSLQRNLWLTRNGKAVSRHQWQMDAQASWNDAYKKATRGSSAPCAWEKMTTKVDPEAYRMMSVLKIHKDLSNVDEIMDNLDPKWVRQISDVTLFKAGEMLKDKSLTRLAGVREACRGTAKDLDGKFLPFINTRLSQLKKIPPARQSASDRHNITRLESALDRFTKVKDSFDAIGKSELPPNQWDDAVSLSTGGKGIMETITDLSDLTQSLFK